VDSGETGLAALSIMPLARWHLLIIGSQG